jgi:uncharacterized RDD family membrane protein YckC
LDGAVLMVPIFLVFMFFGLLEFLFHVQGGPLQSLAGLGIMSVCALISLLYFTLMTSKKGQTLGKMAFNIKVVDAEGNPPAFGPSLGRWFSYLLSGVILYIGYIMAGFTKEKKALHDLIAGTRVVYKGAPNTVAIVLTLVFGLGGAVVVGGITAAIAIPNFARMKSAASDSINKANLKNIQTAIQVYYADQMAYPKDLNSLVPKYLDAVPAVKLDKYGFGSSSQVESYSFLDSTGQVDPQRLKNTGHWLYDPATGKIVIDCTQIDSNGSAIYQYGSF